jgi:hypothetical protein
VDRHPRVEVPRRGQRADSVREREALRRYLDSMESPDAEQQATIDPSAVQAGIDKLRKHPEPEARVK